MKVMLIDIARCNGCYNCQIACKDEHVDNDWPPYQKAQPDTGHYWMHVSEVERGQYPKVKLAFIAKPCMHCEKPSCVKAAKNEAVYKREDEIVVIDTAKSKGQKHLVDACPFGSIYWNEELSIPQKCDFCAHLLDQGWKEPRCVEACPTEALKFGEYDDLKHLIADKDAVNLHPEFGTKPRVYYLGLPKRFVAGAVFESTTDEPLEGAQVSLLNLSTSESVVSLTDNYGDFEFENLEKDGRFSLIISKDGYLSQKYDDVSTEDDFYLGKVSISRQ